MSKAAARQEAGIATAVSPSQVSPKRQKLAAFLVTDDAELWPQIGAHLPAKLVFRQIDSVNELLDAVPTDLPAVVVWDARSSPDKIGELSKLQAHSGRFGMVVLDDGGAEWTQALHHGQLVAHIPFPIDQSRVLGALGNACEEANARAALLGGQGAGPGRSGGDGIVAMTVVTIYSAIGLALGAGVILSGHGGDVPSSPTAHAQSGGASSSSVDTSLGATEWTAPISAASDASSESEAAEEKVDTLIQQAQHAMRDRHFIEPSDGSALALYRSALALDPSSGEARQGLQRLAELLIARVQSAMEQRQFDAALQSLETVRSIDPEDKRLPALDERIAKMRSELGPAEIQAAVNAQNFDRAAQLIEQAGRAKSIGEPRLNALREELRRRRADSDTARLVGVLEARIEQDHLVEPPGDSAVYYLLQARKSGATSAELQAQFRELSRRLSLAAHAAIAQQRLEEAERLAADLRSIGAPLSQVAALQRDIGLARAQHVPAVTQESHLLDLARARLAEGNVVEPQDDSAWHYLSQLTALDPQNASLPSLSKAVQTQILAQGRSALDAGQPAQAESLLELAAALGPSSDAEALRERLRNSRPAPSTGPQEVAEASLTRTRALTIDYPSTALSKHIEGSVEVAYTVTPKGTVSDLTLIASSPAGIFEKAAMLAVGRLRYKPVQNGGRPVAVSTKMLVTFRLAK
jgi:protein TonB